MTSPNAPLIAQYLSGPALVRAAYATLPAVALDQRSPGTWTPRDILAHVADAEVVRAARIRLILAEDMPTLFNFDENLWTQRLGIAPRDPEVSLTTYEALVTSTAEVVAGSLPFGLERAGRHTVDGPLTVQALIERGIAHAAEHAAQLRQ